MSENFLPGHINRHSKQLIYETSHFNIFNDSRRFLTIFKSSVNYNFIFSHSFNFNATSTCDDNLVIPECILTLYSELIIALAKLKNVFFDNFEYQELWNTVLIMVSFNSFTFSRLIYRIIYGLYVLCNLAQKVSVLLFISFLLMLIGFLKKFWRLVKPNLFKTIIAWSPVCFIVFMLISYSHFYVTNCTNNLCSVDVSVSMVLQSIFLMKTLILHFTIASGCLLRLGNIKKLTCWHPKVAAILLI